MTKNMTDTTTDMAVADATNIEVANATDAETENATDAETENAPKGRPEIFQKKQKKKRIKRIIIIVILLALAAAAVFFVPKFIGKTEPTGIPVSAGTADLMDIEEVVSIKGTIEGSDTANVMPGLSSEITSVLVAEGTVVSKGQTLATLDVRDLNEEKKKYETALELSKFQYETAKELVSEGAISLEDYLQKENTYNTDLLNLNSIDFSSKSVIKSPIAGTVTRVNASVGNSASSMGAGQALFVIEDLSRLRMKVRVSEYDISKIQVGQTVKIQSDMIGEDEAYGVVSSIAPTGEQKDTTSSEMVIPVEIDITEANGLIAGVSGRAHILITRSEGALTVPIDAILQDPSTKESKVFIIKDDMTLKSIPVTLGVESTLYVEIIPAEEINAGDKVVLAPDFTMEDGMLVSIPSDSAQ